MLVCSDGAPREAFRVQPTLDREATLQLAKALFPREKMEDAGRGADLSYTCPPDDEINIGEFPGVAVVAAREFGVDFPSKIPSHFLESVPYRSNVYLHAMHSVVDFFGFAYWKEGKLVRSLSLAPDDGILEDIGGRLPFEEPFWGGQHPAVDPEEEPDGYPFPFHPLELGEAALKAFFGYQLEGFVDPSLLEPESVKLLRLKRLKPRWKFWT